MSRLIDADLLMRKCEKWLKPKAPDEDEMVSVADIAVSTLMEIEEQPTAFDVEKVVRELRDLKLWHGDVTGYIARKYKIGSDTIGDNDEGKAGSIPE